MSLTVAICLLAPSGSTRCRGRRSLFKGSDLQDGFRLVSYMSIWEQCFDVSEFPRQRYYKPRIMILALVVALVGSPILAWAAATVALEKPVDLPSGWSFGSLAEDDDSLELFVALKQPQIPVLKAQLAISGTLRYRNVASHYTRQQIREYRKPDIKAVEVVLKWLDSHGIWDRHIYDGWVSFNMTARDARSMVGADLGWYSYGSQNSVLRTRNYTVPLWLKDHVDFVHPLMHFLPPRHPSLQSKPRSEKPPLEEATSENGSTGGAAARDPGQTEGLLTLPCAIATFPECIRKLYNINYNVTLPSPSRVGVAGFLEQYVNYADVANFMDIYAPELTVLDPPYNFTIELINNGSNPQSPIWQAGMEASLDVQYAMSVGYPSNITYYSTGGRGVKLDGSGTEIPTTGSDNEPYLEFLQALLAKPDNELPHVLSISYADDEQSIPRAYALRVCDLFAQLTARGVSVLAASGDGGASGTGQNYCFTNNSNRRKQLIPTFPASCPFVTAIGATDNEGPPVTAAPFSAGGFSSYFSRPSWQDTAVIPYLNQLVRSNNTKLGLFNFFGRAIPDISAVGSGFQIEYGGGGSVVLGTSASTPVVAAMIALINDARLRKGKPSLGWLNPLLYSPQVKGVLTDITMGMGRGCSFGDGQADVDGWDAVEGYDCVTGLGVPGDFERLLQVLG